MKIKATIESIPAGMMIVPLIMGAFINTFIPGIIDIGGFTTALFKNSAPTLIAAYLFCMGAGIRFSSVPRALLQGGTITLSKLIIAMIFGFGIEMIFTTPGVSALSALAIIAAMNNANGGLYAALSGQYGTEKDVSITPVISATDGPILTLLAFGIAGTADISFMAFTVALIPMLIGMILGNLDSDIRNLLTKGGPALIPLFAFSLGTSINLTVLIAGGFAGILLGFLTTFVGGFFNIKADRLAGGSGIAGAAASSTSGSAIMTPAAIAYIDPSVAEIAHAATPLITTSIIVTALLAPLLTSWVAKNNKKRALINSEQKRNEIFSHRRQFYWRK